MRHRTMRNAFLLPAALTAAALLTWLGFAAGAASGPVAQEPPPPSQEAAPQPPAPPAAPGDQVQEGAPAAELPRIIRVVCTDKICGNCDGKCHKGSGHVAIDKKGHCACTPTEGSPLDRATRRAYEKNPPQ